MDLPRGERGEAFPAMKKTIFVLRIIGGGLVLLSSIAVWIFAGSPKPLTVQIAGLVLGIILLATAGSLQKGHFQK
jgi:hypothetical protein